MPIRVLVQIFTTRARTILSWCDVARLPVNEARGRQNAHLSPSVTSRESALINHLVHPRSCERTPRDERHKCPHSLCSKRTVPHVSPFQSRSFAKDGLRYVTQKHQDQQKHGWAHLVSLTAISFPFQSLSQSLCKRDVTYSPVGSSDAFYILYSGAVTRSAVP